MTRIDGQGPMQIPEMHRPDSAKARASRREREAGGAAPPNKADRAEASGASAIHDASTLRKAVEELVESGDLDATNDGNVRRGRVERARQNTANGAYSDQNVLSDIVDRLLQQWRI